MKTNGSQNRSMDGIKLQERSRVWEHCVPACETESPASSINWSIEKAPVDMSSWSSAAALLAERVYIL